ncbi:Uncharacterized protein Fot_56458 [Forsythia ovata]|uniref:Ribosomal protein S14 n=1 Tax=Forsythia ovata TaxID=205694 RepID=A0ABD1NZK3_9LAMI
MDRVKELDKEIQSLETKSKLKKDVAGATLISYIVKKGNKGLFCFIYRDRGLGFVVGIFLPSFPALLLTMSSLPTSPCAIVQIDRVRYYESRYYRIGIWRYTTSLPVGQAVVRFKGIGHSRNAYTKN